MHLYSKPYEKYHLQHIEENRIVYFCWEEPIVNIQSKSLTNFGLTKS